MLTVKEENRIDWKQILEHAAIKRTLTPAEKRKKALEEVKPVIQV